MYLCSIACLHNCIFLLCAVYVYKILYICKNIDRIRKSLGNAYYPYLEMQRRTESDLDKRLVDPMLAKEGGCPVCPKVC